jgi:type II secretory pathway predicted ATPase ExeA
MIKQTFCITKIPFLQSDAQLLPHQQEIADVIHIHTQHGGLCVVTGESGVGKSTLKAHIEEKATQRNQKVINFSRTMDTYNKLLKQIADSLELEEKDKKLENAIISLVNEYARDSKTIITIIDEAHLLDLESLRRLKLLFDRFPRRHNLVLFGQPDLMLRLSLKNYEDIKSRITFSKELKRINDDDLLAFIQRESESVRLPKNTFDEAAIELILRSCNGNLRLCGNLCYASLLEACRGNDRVVDHTHVNAILIQPHWQRHDDLLMRDQPA